MEYLVAWDPDFKLFLNIVKSHLENGWQPCGGIAIGPSPTGEVDPVYFQALTKPTESEFMFGQGQDPD